jgi:hypothetical protein
VQKLLLLSVIGATVLIPVLAARDGQPWRGLGRALFGLLLFCLAYLAVVVWATPDVRRQLVEPGQLPGMEVPEEVLSP